MQRYTSHSEAETRKLGSNMAKSVRKPFVVLLEGDLGTGKTTFIRGLAEGLGIRDTIASPSYTYLRTYVLPESMGTLYHFDLYLLSEKKGDISSIYMDEALQDPNAIIVIEWAQYLPKRPANALNVHFKNLSESEREIVIGT